MAHTSSIAIKVLGIVGGLLGILIGFFYILSTILSGEAGQSGGFEGGNLFILLGFVGLIGTFVTSKRRRLGSALLLSSGFLGFIIGADLMPYPLPSWKAWVIPGTLLVIGGILALIAPEKIWASLPLARSESRSMRWLGYSVYTIITLFALLFIMNAFLSVPPNPETKQKNDFIDAEMAMGMGATDAAIDAYDRIIDNDPKNVEAWMGKGNAFYRLGKATNNSSDYVEAIQSFDKVIELNQSFVAEAWSYKGTALNALGQTHEANRAFAKSKELGYIGDPTSHWYA